VEWDDPIPPLAFSSPCRRKRCSFGWIFVGPRPRRNKRIDPKVGPRALPGTATGPAEAVGEIVDNVARPTLFVLAADDDQDDFDFDDDPEKSN
jgi:hypothetical protein